MLRGPSAKVVAALMALALLGSACSSRDDDDASTDSGSEDDTAAGESSIDTADCVSDPTVEVGDSIKLVSSYPQSGLTAAFSEIARGWKAYFDKVNAEGGVDFGGKTVTIEYEDADDQYNAADDRVQHRRDGRARGRRRLRGLQRGRHGQQPRHPRHARRAVRAEHLRGHRARPRGATPTTRGRSARRCRRTRSRPRSSPSCIEVQQPGAQVAMLVQDDDFGAAYEETLRAAIEEQRERRRGGRGREVLHRRQRGRRADHQPRRQRGRRRSSTAARCWRAPTP